MNNDQKWVNQQTLNSQLLEKKELTDKNLRSYLILRLEQLDGIFVFHSNVKEERWGDLSEGKEYTFEIGENEKGYLNLLDFSY
jgi:hypothetical protein